MHERAAQLLAITRNVAPIRRQVPEPNTGFCAGRIPNGSMFSSGAPPTSTTSLDRIIALSNAAALPCWASNRSEMQR